ncbi:MAG: hypothetical protein U0790_14190 [Isosphaeraceae bacterium]
MNQRTRSILIAIVLVAIAVRLAAVLILQSHLVPRSTYEHGEIAANLLAGRGFSIRFLGGDGPTSQQAPVYPLLVAAAYAVGGVETPRSLLFLEAAQSLLGGMLVLAVFQLARRIAPGRPAFALLASGIVAVHPTLVYAATHVQVALLAATLLCTFLELSHRAGASGRTASAALAGLILALLALTDPILALAGIGGIWAMAQETRDTQGRWDQVSRLVATMCFTAALGIAPWIVRNAWVHGEFVAIKSTFGYAFWQGNCLLSEGTDKVVRSSVERVLAGGDQSSGLAGLNRTLWQARHEAGYIDDVALSRRDLQQLGRLGEPERSRVLFRRAIGELREQPGRYLKLCLRRFRYFWLFDESNPKTRSVIYRAGHLGLTAMAVVGLFLAGPALRRRLAPTLAVAIVISIFHALTIVSARFHIPIEPLMAIWAAAGLARQQCRPEISAPHRHHIVGVGVERGLRGRLGVDRLA